jgi:hypothetical protein
MATTRELMLDRLNSLCADDPFRFVQAQSPFDFTNQPSGVIDQVYRIEIEASSSIGGTNFSEETTDLATIWIARKHQTAHHVSYRQLVTDITSLRSAIVRDGATGGGDYGVPDGGGVSFQHDTGKEYAMARLSLPINYESEL